MRRSLLKILNQKQQEKEDLIRELDKEIILEKAQEEKQSLMRKR